MTTGWDRYTLPLMGAITLAALPHLISAPRWLTVGILCFAAMVTAAVRRHRKPPSRAVKWLLIVAGVVAVKMTFTQIVGQEPGICLFLIMAFLKLLEVRSPRDRMVSLCMAYFLLAANLFFHQSLIMAAHMLLSVWITTAVMIHIQERRARWDRHLRESSALVLQALPVMVVLFILFPRIQGSLWGVPRQVSGSSGFSARLSLGDVSSIVQNNAVAFRATIGAEPLPPEDRYWRGIVFWNFDGVAWERGRSLPPQGKMVVQERPLTYSITLEPSGERWLFALDMPAGAPPGTWMNADYTLRATGPTHQRVTYPLTSYRRYQTPQAPPWDIRRGLQLPDGNPRTVALGRRWAERYPASADIVSAALTWMTEGGLVYTLDPPPPQADPVDQFLFDTKRGYCEHFAAAFALLMRAAGVPARVVGGYLGGEPNPYGDYLIIRQSDAHAWVEILDERRGWVRIDPTALVAPNRVVRSVAEAVPAEELPAYLVMEGYGRIGKALRVLRLSWDSANTRWHRWVAAYSQRHQDRLLSRVGLSMKPWRGAALLGLLAVAGTALIVWAMTALPPLRRRQRPDAAVSVYNTFLKAAARAGLPPKEGHEGPLRYARRIVRRRSDLAEDITAITGSYVRCRYGSRPTPEDLDDLRRRVRRFQRKQRSSPTQRMNSTPP